MPLHPVTREVIEADRKRLRRKLAHINKETPVSDAAVADRNRRKRDVELQLGQLDNFEKRHA